LENWPARDPYDQIVVGINFGGEPQEPVRYLPGGSKEPGPRNRRAEMWDRSKEWLNAPGGADIPDLNSLHADACGPGYSYDAEPVKDVPRREGNRAPLHRFEYDPFSYEQEGEQEWRYSSADRADIAYHTERLRRRALGLPE
jgi:hypothetical protein